MKISTRFLLLSATLFIGAFCWFGCVTSKNYPHLYPAPTIEAEWIRNGQPLEFEKELWYPTDIVENLLDNEVYLLGEYRGVQFFSDKTDVRPFERLYTKFDQHRFRVFEKRAIK